MVYDGFVMNLDGTHLKLVGVGKRADTCQRAKGGGPLCQLCHSLRDKCLAHLSPRPANMQNPKCCEIVAHAIAR